MNRRTLQSQALLLTLSFGLTACSKLRHKPADEYVYVTAKQTYLRDRTAAVSNRTAQVSNGDRLKVLEHSRHWLHVSTDSAQSGWIDEKVVASQATYDQFTTLRDQHQKDPVVAQGTARDEVNLHVAPGRDTDHFFRLAENDKVQLLARASVEHAGVTAKPAPAKPGAAKAADDKPAAPEPPPMEDWWLVRDAKGDTGWILSRMIDVETPDALMRYSEGQRIVGAYVLTKINDPEAPQDDKDVPVYVTVTSPFKAGLPYDFDQVRVYTWNKAKHRYETGYRERDIEGYLPITMGEAKDPTEKGQMGELSLPTFTYRVLAADAPPVTPDPKTGLFTPAKTIAKTYRLEGNIVRRITPPAGVKVDQARPTPEEKKEDKKKRKR